MKEVGRARARENQMWKEEANSRVIEEGSWTLRAKRKELARESLKEAESLKGKESKKTKELWRQRVQEN